MLRNTVALILDHRHLCTFLLAIIGTLLLINFARRLHIQAIFQYTVAFKKPIEDKIALYMETWKQIEARAYDVNFDWTKGASDWNHLVRCLLEAYGGFETLASQFFFFEPILPSLPPAVPPEISHVRPDTIRQEFKQFWVEHRQRVAVIKSFTEPWNHTLAVAEAVLKDDIRRVAQYH